MLFTTLEYAAFFVAVLVVHWLLPRPARRIWLLAASYWFYSRTIPQYVWLISGLTLANYLLGLALSRCAGRTRRVLLIVAIAGNLATLAFFKYTVLLVAALWPALRAFPLVATDSPAIAILLPLGISFFTFEFIHYQVEVARGQPPIRDPLEFALFAAFFPTQIAGPIKRFPDWVRARSLPMALRDLRVDEGLWLIARGAFKKIVVADALAPLVAGGFGHAGQLGAATTWFVMYAFAAQIFADFSGYTDIGRGCALLLGFSVPENFNHPYHARDPAEFWERWHISLSRWLRDYLFIPLGGSRVPRGRLYLNLLITMGLGGLWHGASWHFMLWGIYQGGLLIAFRLWQGGCQRVPVLERAIATPHGVLLGRIVTFHLVCLGWLIFRAENVAAAGTMLRAALIPGGLAPLAGYATLLPGSKALPTMVLALTALVVVAGWLGAWAGAIFTAHTDVRYARPASWERLLAGFQVMLTGALPWLRPAWTLALLGVVAVWPAQTAQTFIYFQF